MLGKKEESNKHANVALILNCSENQTRKRALQECSRKIFLLGLRYSVEFKVWYGILIMRYKYE